MPVMDINADLGEGGLHDAELIGLVSSVNIACGGHAGNDAIMRICVEAAKASGTAIGAHPGYEDPDNFGRVELDLQPHILSDQLQRQLERILTYHPQLHHIKAHGALYNQANVDPAIAATLILVIKDLQPDALLYCPPNGEMAKAAEQVGIKVWAEGFMDRAYLNDGSLCPRTDPEALIEDFGQAAAQAMQITMSQSVESLEGEIVPLSARTLCIHGDHADAPEMLAFCRKIMERAGVEISAS